MAYDEELACRIRDLTADQPDMVERKMFGGLCFMRSGNMCFGVVGSELMVRVGPESFDAVIALPHAREMDFTGGPSRGMVYVEETGIADDRDLTLWLQRGLDFANSLPPK